MKKSFVLLFVVLLGLFFILASNTNMQDIKDSRLKVKKPDGQSPSATIVKRDPDFGNIPLYFIPNKGQKDEKARFYSKTSRYTLWMTKEGLVFDSIRKTQVEVDALLTHSPHSPTHPSPERDVSRLIFLDANSNPGITPVGSTQHKVNYFKGNDPSKWHTGIQTSTAVLYKNVYKNIDLNIYGIEKQIEYDWIVKPGADPKAISFKYEQVFHTRIGKEGNLIIETKFGNLIHKKPISYQVIDGKKITIESKFKKRGKNTYRFEVKKYNKNYELIIDPMVCLIYSTYLGGSVGDNGCSIAVDSDGYAYVTGLTESLDFPTENPYQGTLNGSCDVFVTKLSPSGKNLVYSTYLGGSNGEGGISIVVDMNRNVYVAGTTSSSNFPTKNPYQWTYSGNQDAFVTKLSPAGNTLLYSTYLGGSSYEYCAGIAIDRFGSAYLTGETGSRNFPLMKPFQDTIEDVVAAFVTKLSPTGNSLVYSTYLGGKSIDYGYSIVVDRHGSAYVTGATRSGNFPKKNPFQRKFGGNYDVFVTKFSPAGDTLVYSTYLGGSSNDYCGGIAIDRYGSAYVTGYTWSADFHTKNPYQGSLNGSEDVFMTKFSPAGNTLVYSTYLGGSNGEYGSGIAVDMNGSAYVTGQTRSTDFPRKNPFQGIFGGGYNDAFVTKLSPAGDTLLYSTYLGGNGRDYLYGNGIAVDSYGDAYLTGYTTSSDFPTHNAFQNSYAGGDSDAFVTRLCFCDSTPVLVVNKSLLNFAVNGSGIVTGDQKFLVRNIGEGTLNWTVSDNATWLECNPTSGTNFGVVTVSVNASGLSPDIYTGTITVTDANAINSPQTIAVTLTVYESGGGLPVQPFGFFETPEYGVEVMGSVPVTGWALDDIEVLSVKLYREIGPNLIYFGDALFVEGARPDVAQVYPQYPFSSRAGWGYMMLTNALPDGSYKIHAIATDKEGNQVTLGTKSMTINNAIAVKPFGAIDTPAPGEAISGDNYRIQGWALTPPPNKIPSYGVRLFIDGVDLGEATYKIFRQDIYDLFPGYKNRNGALAYYDYNTLGYDNGMHTVQFVATDDANNTDGIGSCYFNIWNLGTLYKTSQVASKKQFSMSEITEMPVEYTESVMLKKGYNPSIEPETVYPDEKGNITIEIKELERIVIHLNEIQAEVEKKSLKNSKFNIQNSKFYSGYLLAGQQLWPLPIGSTMDSERGIFYWLPGPGFIGEYRLVFVEKEPDGAMSKKLIKMKILSKFGK